MADQEQKGRQLLAEAEKKIASSKGFASSFFGGASKIEDAIDCYKRAAIAFKQAKNWKECGNAYCQAGGLYTKTDSKHDAAQCFIDAGNAYKKIDPLDAVNCISKAIEIYTDMGRFTMAAKNYQNIAEIYENEANNLEKAIEYYEKAADCFQGEESRTSANKCFLKVAQYSAHLEQYEKAIQIYEQVASDALKSPLLKHSAKEYYFRAALCHLCVDSLNAQHAIERYQDECPPFQDAREYKLIMTIIGHIEEQNAEGFTEAVKDYDSISRLDQWYTTILLRIKKQINENPDLR